MRTSARYGRKLGSGALSSLLFERLTIRCGSPDCRKQVVDMTEDDIESYLDFFEAKIVPSSNLPSRKATSIHVFAPNAAV